MHCGENNYIILPLSGLSSSRYSLCPLPLIPWLDANKAKVKSETSHCITVSL